jgi:hypothetical protein
MPGVRPRARVDGHRRQLVGVELARRDAERREPPLGLLLDLLVRLAQGAAQAVLNAVHANAVAC